MQTGTADATNSGNAKMTELNKSIQKTSILKYK